MSYDRFHYLCTVARIIKIHRQKKERKKQQTKNKTMRTYRFMFPVLLAMTATGSLTAGPSDKGSSGIRFPEVNQVKIEDTFWKPKLNLWQKVTVNDVFDKFE